MLEWLLEQWWHITAVLDEEKCAATRKAKKQAVVRNLDNKQWGVAAKLIYVLQPFTVQTTFLSAQNISVSCVLPLMDRLHASLKPTGKDSQALKEFKRCARSDIWARFSFDESDSKSIAMLTSALDPHFEAFHFLRACQGQQVAN